MIPGPHVAVVFADVALCAGRNKVGAIGRAALCLWRHVVERDFLRLAPAVGAAAAPGVDDLAPEAALCDPLGDQLRSLNSVGSHLGQLLQPDPGTYPYRTLKHAHDLVSGALGQVQGHITQHLAGGLLIPGANRGMEG